MATYLIDYENVHKSGLNGVKELPVTDSVIIFVGNQINDIPFDTVYAILCSSAQIKMKKMKKTAKDYLDFQLATCLGGLVESKEEREFYIISGDSGFEAVIDYWKSNKPSVSVKQQTTISSQSPAVTATKAIPVAATIKLDNATKKRVRDIVQGEKLNPGQYTGIYNLFMHESDKQNLHHGLVRLFEQKQGSRLYGLLKDEFEQYKANGQ